MEVKGSKGEFLLFKPQGEVGGVSDHPQQVGGVNLFVLFGPDTANQLRWLHRPAGGQTGVCQVFDRCVTGF